MKILVTGAEGMLGRAVVEHCSRDPGTDIEAVGIDLADGDLSEAAVADRLLRRHGPDWVVHCAAFTAVDAAETERARALAVNAEATAHLVGACRSSGAGLTYISTDYVFAGVGAGYDEDDVRDPVNYYGLTKARGEETVEALAGSATPWQILRTSWLFGHGPANFVKTIRRLLQEKDRLSVVDDQRGCPTYSVDLAKLICCLLRRGVSGKFHGTNQGACTWYEFARAIARVSGADPDRITPCATAAYPTPARRPACSVLRATRLVQTGCEPLPAWQDALERYVAWLDSEPASERDCP